MARKPSKALLYFPVRVDNHDTPEMDALISEFGVIAEFVDFKLRSLIFKNNFYIKWDQLVYFEVTERRMEFPVERDKQSYRITTHPLTERCEPSEGLMVSAPLMSRQLDPPPSRLSASVQPRSRMMAATSASV